MPDLDDAVPMSRIVEDYCYGILSFNLYEHVTFVHLTAAEYFKPLIQVWFPECASQMATSCLKVLDEARVHCRLVCPYRTPRSLGTVSILLPRCQRLGEVC